jgi:hypothetical protein
VTVVVITPGKVIEEICAEYVLASLKGPSVTPTAATVQVPTAVLPDGTVLARDDQVAMLLGLASPVLV